MSGKVDVLWCRQVPDEFVHYGGDRMRLFRVFPLPPGEKRVCGSQVLYVAQDRYASLVSSNASVPLVRCVSWCPVKEQPHFIAAGQQNGRVTVTAFGQEEKGQPISFGLELTPRTTRPCLAVEWNAHHHHLIGVGLEKARSDFSLLVWDLNDASKKSLLDNIGPLQRSVIEGASATLSQPAFEQGHGEATVSFTWLNHQPSTLLAGIGRQSLKIYDLRDETFRPNSATTTRAIYGVCVDPFEHDRLASYGDNGVAVWDFRSFNKPIMTIHKAGWNGLSKISWSPTRRGTLGVLAKDSPSVRLFDVQHAPFAEADFFHGSDLTDAMVEQLVVKGGENHMSSFTWHPSYSNRMLAVGSAGDVHDITINERLSLSWRADGCLAWSCGSVIGSATVQTPAMATRAEAVDAAAAVAVSPGATVAVTGREEEEAVQGDISGVMKRRAVEGYGLNTTKNIQIVSGDEQLVAMWQWLMRCQALIAGGKLPSSSMSAKNIGLQHLLSKSAGDSLTPSLAKKGGADISVRQYQSLARRQIQRLCGWDFDADSLEDCLKRLELDRQYERAAAIALFNLQQRRAVECLTTGSRSQDKDTSNLHLVAMALAGFSSSSTPGMWHDVCGSVKSRLHHPYIVAAFSFLSGVASMSKPPVFPHAAATPTPPTSSVNSSPFAAVLFESGMTLADKVAFACCFLTDAQLSEFIQKVTSQMEADGRLDGLLLTGVDASGMRLLQTYLDKTGDLQTVCLVVALCGGFSDTSQTDGQANTWLESYRDLLDRWRLWHCRAQLDVGLNQIGATTGQTQQIVACCGFCSRSIASDSGRGSSAPNRQSVTPTRRAQPRISACPNCRKPLPRCSLCLINMGTASQYRSTADGSCLRPGKQKKSMFSDWLTWCQSCHHGGHSAHMHQWFKDHVECSVTNCRCRCAQLDQYLLKDVESEAQ